MFGHITAFEAVYDFYPQPNDVIWSPADWAWIAGIMDILVPAWWYGVPVVVDLDTVFSADRAVWLMREHKITLTLLPATALRVIRASGLSGEGLSMRVRRVGRRGRRRRSPRTGRRTSSAASSTRASARPS